MQMKKAIIIGGPTASGKTGLAIQLATHFSTEIISCDSRQCYQEMSIGVARPTPAELAQVTHHFIAAHSVLEEVNAAMFEEFALQQSNKIFEQHDYLIMVGGTGLYIKAYTDGIDQIPAIDSAIRTSIIADYQNEGIQWLQERIMQEDPLYLSSGEMQNPQRMMRALEVVRGTGHSIREFQRYTSAERPFQSIKIALELPRELLISRIDQRVDQMISNGLVEEVQSLLPFKNLGALQTVGYRELFDYFDGSSSLEAAIERIKINTRQYAKRQVTWLKKQGFEWFKPNELEKMLKWIALQ